MIWLHVEYNSLRESMDELLITSRDHDVPDFDSIDYWETSTGSHVFFLQFMIYIYSYWQCMGSTDEYLVFYCQICGPHPILGGSSGLTWGHTQNGPMA